MPGLVPGIHVCSLAKTWMAGSGQVMTSRMVELLPNEERRLGEVKRTQFERTALLLQGGGAPGAYQGGVYQGLAEADLHPDWVAGISIGAINSALIAGNPPAKRVERLREFWETVSASPV